MHKLLDKGFTLIEVSIVLIIIGLISASILVGRDLIEAAGVRAEISQIEKLNTAVNTFRSKYNCIPGDCARALDFGLANAGAEGDFGDGDGRISRLAPDDMDGQEIRNLWFHLGRANLIESMYEWGSVPGVNSPSLKLTGIGISSNPDNNAKGGVWLGYFSFPAIELGAGNPIGAWVLTSTSKGGEQTGVYLPSKAYGIDSKIDDGLPLTGRVRSGGGSLQITCAGGQDATCGGYDSAEVMGTDDNYCIDTSFQPARYRVTAAEPSTTSLCTPVIKASFYY